MNSLYSLSQSYIGDVSKNKLKVSNEVITQIKSLNYDQFIFVIKQFQQEIEIACNDKQEYTVFSTKETDYTKSYETYKHYPIHIKQYLDTTELIAITAYDLSDRIICVKDNKPLFIPVIAERVSSKYTERRLHAMTLVFDTEKHNVFLHDPNSRSLFNNTETISLLKTYVENINNILKNYGMCSYTFICYEFDNMNINIDFIFHNNVHGNCVVASILFMILYDNIQEVSYIESVLLMSKKDDYKTVYIGLYNKIQEYLKYIM